MIPFNYLRTNTRTGVTTLHTTFFKSADHFRRWLQLRNRWPGGTVIYTAA